MIKLSIIRKCKNCNKVLGKRIRKWTTGYCQLCRLKFLQPALGKKRPDMIGKLPVMYGKNNPEWKGDKVGYVALHNWVKRNLGKPKKCELCRRSNLVGRLIHWANKSGKYLRDLNDWIRLCAKCHFKYDNQSFGRN